MGSVAIFKGKLVKFLAKAGILVPARGDADRSLLPSAGEMAFNTDASKLEVYNGTGWDQLSSSGGGGAAVVEDFINADHVISTNQTLSSVQASIKSDLGDSITTGQRILFRGQTNASENGIYTYSSFAIFPITFNSLTSPELASLTFFQTSIAWEVDYYGFPPPSQKDEALGTQFDYSFSSSAPNTAYISSDGLKVVVYLSSSQCWIALKFGIPVPLNTVPDQFQMDQWDSGGPVGITVTGINNPDITTGDTLYQAGTPTYAVYSRTSDANDSNEFFYGRKVYTPSAIYRYDGNTSPTIGSTALSFNKYLLTTQFETNGSDNLGDIENKFIILSSTSTTITIGNIKKSIIIVKNIVNLNITGNISDSQIIGSTDNFSIPGFSNAAMSISGNLILNSNIKWMGSISFVNTSGSVRISGCEIKTNNLINIGTLGGTNTFNFTTCSINANGNIIANRSTNFDACSIIPYETFYISSNNVNVQFRNATSINSRIFVNAANVALYFQWFATGNISELTFTAASTGSKLYCQQFANINVGKLKYEGAINANSCVIQDNGCLKASSIYSVNALTTNTGTNGTLSVNVIETGSAAINSAPAGSRNFVSYGNSRTWHTSAGVWGSS